MTNKSYRISFKAVSVNKQAGTHPSSKAIGAAVENALRLIGVEPVESQTEGSAEYESAVDPSIMPTLVTIERKDKTDAREEA